MLKWVSIVYRMCSWITQQLNIVGSHIVNIYFEGEPNPRLYTKVQPTIPLHSLVYDWIVTCHSLQILYVFIKTIGSHDYVKITGKPLLFIWWIITEVADTGVQQSLIVYLTTIGKFFYAMMNTTVVVIIITWRSQGVGKAKTNWTFFITTELQIFAMTSVDRKSLKLSR